MEKIISAEEIIKVGNKPSNLPEGGGLKFFKHNPNSSDQIESVTSAREQYLECIKEQRICRKMNLSIANWKSDENLALVEVVKGSTLQKFGFQTCDGKFLYPEECMFLVEQGILELNLKNMPMSFQEVYMLLLPILPSYEYYLVFSHLCRLGYLVTRYKKSIKDIKPHRWDISIESSDTDAVRTETDKNTIPESLKSGYMKALWNGDPTPLLQPSQATSTSAVLSKLKSSCICHLKDYAQGGKNRELEICFDVYVSKEMRKQAKSESGNAQFRIAVCNYHDNPPTLAEWASLTQHSGDVHLKIGVVNQATVTFYGMFSVDLPTIITQP